MSPPTSDRCCYFSTDLISIPARHVMSRGVYKWGTLTHSWECVRPHWRSTTKTITVVDTSVSLLCSVTYSPSGLIIFQPNCLPLGRENGCCHYSNGLTSHLRVKVHNIGVCGIQWPIWLESTLFTVRIKLCFHTSYFGSFLNKAWCHRVTMVSLLELLSLMKSHNTLEPRKHHT